MSDKIRIAHVGGGYWGKNIIRNLHALGFLELICDVDQSSLDNYKKQYPGVLCVTDFNEILKNKKIDAISIATPAATHFTLVREALNVGKHVFVEKPLALRPKEGKELAELAKQKKLILMVGHILRYHPAIDKIKELIVSDALGRIGYCYSNRLNLGKIRSEENILWSFAPHDISILIYLMGGPPDEVSASGEIILQPGIHDVTLTVMKWKSGVSAHINVSWLHPYKEQKLVIVGDKAMLVFDDTKENEKLMLYKRGIDFVKGHPVKREDDVQIVDYENKEPLKAEMEHFIECIKTGAEPKTGAIEALAVLNVLHKAQLCLTQSDSHGEAQYSDRDYFAHETAVIDDGAQIGEDTKIWHFTHVMPKAQIGKKCSLGQNVSVANNVVIGDNVKIQNNVSLYEGVILEDRVFCGPSMVFTNVKNPRSGIPRNTSEDYLKTHVRKGASLGANCTIVCGITIGENAFVAAGAVVTKNVPPNALMAGVPAKQIGWMCESGYRIKSGSNKNKCLECEKSFDLEELDRVGGIGCPKLEKKS